MTRKDYMDGRVSHQDYYYHLGEVIGLPYLRGLVQMIAPIQVLQSALESDPHLNNIPLGKWDKMHPAVLNMVDHHADAVMAVSWSGVPLKPHTYCWSLSDSVCVLKAVARHMAEETV